MSDLMTTTNAEELRQLALHSVRTHDFETALDIYDRARESAKDDELRELITINKADVLITLQRSGPEVAELARVVMRRRNPRHVCLAAYALLYKHRMEQDYKRALFYGHLALRAAEEFGDREYERAVLVDLGNVYEMQSDVDRAVECFESALRLIPEMEEHDNRSRGYTLENLGYCRLLQGETDRGTTMLHDALRHLDDDTGKAEAYIDLCFAYLEKEELEQAESYGQAGLRIATEERQIRNAHFLLGEVACKREDSTAADFHFGELGKFYPNFRHLKNLLMAVDLRSMVNLKA
jgi:tetratricopeptide (TPR) repeat protein